MNMKIAIVYGSTTGNTEAAAEKIREELSDADLINVSQCNRSTLENYDLLVLGTSTWGIGDIQDDWAGALDDLGAANLSGKKVAIFGLGDQQSYSDSFVDGIGDLYKKAKSAGAEIIGFWPTDEYSFSSEKPVIDGEFAGLPLDEDNEPEKTDERIHEWIAQIKQEAGLL